MTAPTVCVINYNGESFLEESLGAVQRIASRVAEIVVVDNGSTDGSRALVERCFPHVRWVSMPANLGAAAARNAALAQSETDLVLLVDNDVSLTPGAVEEMMGALRCHPDAVTAMPTILYGGDPATIQYDGAQAHYLGQQVLEHPDARYGEAPVEVRQLNSIISACILVDRSRLPLGSDAALFDEDFFIYFEDHDFGYRMRALGRDVLAVPAACCHHGSGTPGLSIRALGSYSRRRVFFVIRNRWLFILKNYSVRTLVLLSPMLALYEAIQLAGVIKKGWLREWVAAARWVVVNLPRIHRKRRQFQRARTRRDGALLSGGPVPLRPEATTSPLERGVRRLLDLVAGGYWGLVRGWA